MRLILYVVLTFSVSFIYANPGGEGDDGSKDSTNVFFKYSLDELLNKKITVASKGEEKSNEAPAFTSNYSNNDIQYYGYYTLGDLANITSGYSKDHALYGENGFETRGQRAGSFENDRHLMLLDGIPIYFARSNKAFTQYDMPLMGVENVSFLKGPGSALYGVSAFYGVLDLKTLSLEENGFHTQAKLTYGSDDFEKRMMHSLNYKNDKGEFKIGLTFYDKLPSYDNVDSINGSSIQDRKNWDQNNTFFINTSYQAHKGKFKGLSFGYLSSKRKTGIGEFWDEKNSQNNYIDWATNVLYSKYSREIGKKINLNSYIFHNVSVEEGGYQRFPSFEQIENGDWKTFNAYKRSTSNTQLSSELKAEFKKHNVIIGINSDYKAPVLGNHSYTSSSNIVIDTINSNASYPDQFNQEGDNDSIITLSVYYQDKFKFNLLEGLLFTLGFRYDYGISISNTFNSDKLSPRLAIVQKVTKKLNIKLLYGSALRTPNIKIVGLNNEFNKKIEVLDPGSGFKATRNLKAEVIHSIDFGINYRTKRLFVEGNVFYNRALDQINRRRFETTGNTALNYNDNDSGKVNTMGYEFNLKYIPKKGTQVFANYSYAFAEDRTLTKDPGKFKFFYIPLAKTNIGVTTKLDKRGVYRISSAYKLIHAYRVQETENTMGIFHSLDVNFILKPTSMLSIEVQLLDALNSETGSFSNELIIPSRGRRLMLSVGFEF